MISANRILLIFLLLSFNGSFLSNFRMADLAVDALNNLLCRPNSHKFPTTVMEIMEKYVGLMDTVQFQLNSPEPDEVCYYLLLIFILIIIEGFSANFVHKKRVDRGVEGDQISPVELVGANAWLWR